MEQKESIENYIARLLKQGYTSEQIGSKLRESGWNQEQINQAFVSYRNSLQPESDKALVTELSSGSSLLKTSLSLIKDNLGKIVNLYLVTMAILFILAIPLVAYSIYLTSTSQVQITRFLFIGFAILAILQIPLFITFIKILDESDDEVGFFNLYKSSFSAIPRFVATIIVTMLIFYVGLLLFVIPGIIFATWFFSSVYITILENKGPIASLKTSKNYVRGLGKKVFGKFIYLSIFMFFIGIVSMVTTFLFNLMDLRFVSYILNFLINLVGSVLPFTYLFVVYKELKDINNSSKQLSSSI